MPTEIGYCGRCHMIVDLDGNRLARHGERKLPGEQSQPCPGTGSLSSVLPETPEVAAAAFTEERRPAKCPRCDNPSAIGGEAGQRLYMRGHLPPGGAEGDALCPGSWASPTYAV